MIGRSFGSHSHHVWFDDTGQHFHIELCLLSNGEVIGLLTYLGKPSLLCHKLVCGAVGVTAVTNELPETTNHQQVLPKENISKQVFRG